MVRQRLIFVAAALTASAFIAAASGDTSRQTTQPEQQPKVDLYGDPLPPGAVARLGTVRYRSEGYALGFLPDSKTLVSAPRFGMTGPQRIQFWDAFSGQLTREIVVEASVVREATMSKDGKLMALALHVGTKEDWSMPREVQIWDLALGKIVQRFPRGSEEISTGPMAFSPDGKLLFSIGDRQILRIENIESGTEILRRQFQATTWFYPYPLAISADGTAVAVGLDPAFLWRWQIGQEPIELKNPEKFSSSTCLTFSPDGKWLLDCGSSKGRGPMRLRDLATGKIVDPPRPLSKDHHISSVCYTPDGKTLIAFCTSKGESAMELWDAATWQFQRRLNGFAAGAAFVSPDGRFLAGKGTPTRLWDLTADKMVSPIDEAHDDEVRRMSTLGDLVATATYRGDIRLWEARNGKHRLKFRHGENLSHMAMSPDGTRLLTSGGGKTFCLWDTSTGKPVFSFPTEDRSERCRAIAFTPDSKFFLTCDNEWRMRKWEVTTGKAVLEHRFRPAKPKPDPTQPPPHEPDTPVGFSADGKSFILTGLEEVAVFDVETGRVRYRQSVVTRYANNVACSFDNRLLLLNTRAKAIETKLPNGEIRYSSAKEHLVELWELSSGKMRMKLLVPGSTPGPLAFSPDGRMFAEGIADPPTIRIWDSSTGKELPPITGFHGRPISLAFTSDNTLLISGMDDTTALVWELKGP